MPREREKMKTVEQINKAIQSAFKNKPKTGATPDGKKITNKDIYAEFVIGNMVQIHLGYYNEFICTLGNLKGELKFWQQDQIPNPVDRALHFYWMNPKTWNEAVNFVRRDILMVENKKELDAILKQINETDILDDENEMIAKGIKAAVSQVEKRLANEAK